MTADAEQVAAAAGAALAAAQATSEEAITALYAEKEELEAALEAANSQLEAAKAAADADISQSGSATAAVCFPLPQLTSHRLLDVYCLCNRSPGAPTSTGGVTCNTYSCREAHTHLAFAGLCSTSCATHPVY